MSVYMFSDRTKKSIADCVGLTFDKICNLSLEEEIAIASKKYGRKIVFSQKRDSRHFGRGNPLLSSRKFRTLEEVEKRIARIK